MKTIRVRVSFEMDLELTDEEYEMRHTLIEENGCPGTGMVGAKLEAMIEDANERHVCWACGPANGENKIIKD